MAIEPFLRNVEAVSEDDGECAKGQKHAGETYMGSRMQVIPKITKEYGWSSDDDELFVDGLLLKGAGEVETGDHMRYSVLCLWQSTRTGLKRATLEVRSILLCCSVLSFFPFLWLWDQWASGQQTHRR